MLLSEKCDEGCIYAEISGMQHHQCHGACSALEEEEREASEAEATTPPEQTQADLISKRNEMMNTTIQEALARMQTKRPARPTVWMNPNGTFSHHRDGKREWADEDACRTDLRFHEEWAR